MKKQYIMLRRPAMSPNKQPSLGNGKGIPGRTGTEDIPQAQLPGLRIEVDEINNNKIDDLKNDKTIYRMAPSLPVKLIDNQKTNPVDISNKKISWGVQAVGADTSPFTGDGIVVAVLDSGINRSHPAFDGVKIIEEDFTGEGNGDQSGHGTQVAGTIFGREVDGIHIGVATGVKKALIGKVIGQEKRDTAGVIEAMQWAANNGANVISMSLGFDFARYVNCLQEKYKYPRETAISVAFQDYYENMKLFRIITEYIQQIIRLPVIIVAAAGNESDRSSSLKIQVSPPGILENIIAVGAILQGEKGGFKIAPYSNTGAEICAPGENIITASVEGGITVDAGGTSIATPHVAGVAALWAEKLQKNNQLTSNILTARLLGTAITNKFEETFNADDFGAGLVYAPQD